MGKTRTALLAGATGLIGSHCLKLLLDDPAYSKVTIIARKKIELNHPKLVAVCINFDQLDELSAKIDPVDDAFCCLGTTLKAAGSKEAFHLVDYTYCLEYAKLALKLQAKQFLLVSSLGADSRSGVFYSRVKGELEDALKVLSFGALKIFQPSLLLGARTEVRAGEAIAQKILPALSPLFRGPLRKYKAIEGSDVAAAMVAVAKKDVPGSETFQSDRISQS